jgi:hypothetical protein
MRCISGVEESDSFKLSRHFVGLILLVEVLMLVATQHDSFGFQATHVPPTNSKIFVQEHLATALFEFTPNRGQLADQFGRTTPAVKYYSNSRGVKFYFTSTGIHYFFHRKIFIPQDKELSLAPQLARGELRHDSLESYRVDMQFLGANPNARIEELDQSEGYSNFFLAQCWPGITNVPAFHQLIYHDLYPKIDMVLYSREGGGMKYDFVVHPGGDPSRIQMRYDGADSVFLEGGGLSVTNPFGVIQEAAPESFQIIGRDTTTIASPFHIHNKAIGFTLGRYDESRDLIIDPPRLWGTYYGGAGEDDFYGLTIDRGNNIISVGTTSSISGIATSGAYLSTFAGNSDAMIVKLDASGSRVWATYYGGSDDEAGFGIVSDKNSNLYISGSTRSNTGIVTTGAFQTSKTSTYASSFISRFTSSGNLVWGTYFGNSAGHESANEIALDSAGYIDVVGTTASGAGIATTGAHLTTNSGDPDAYLVRFDSNGVRRWATYYGGDNLTNGYGIATDLHCNIFICGATNSTTGIGTTGTWEPSGPSVGGSGLFGYAARFDSSGSYQWGTYIAHGGYAEAICVVVAPNSTLLLTGWVPPDTAFATTGAYQTTCGGGGYDAYLLRLNANGTRRWATFYGGTGLDEADGIAVNAAGDVLFCGYTASTTAIATSGEFQSTFGGFGDGFMAKFDSNGVRKWATYYGGTDDDIARRIVYDHANHIVLSGYTKSSSGVGTTNGFQSSFGGGLYDGFVARFCDTLAAALSSTIGDTVICRGSIDTLSAPSGFASYQWQQNGVDITGATSSKYAVPTTLAAGAYRFTVLVSDASVCQIRTDTIRLTLTAGPTISAGTPKSICVGSSVQIGTLATGGVGPYSYSWSPATGLSATNIAKPFASPTATTKYFITVTGADGCQSRDTVTITLRPQPSVQLGPDVSMCLHVAVPIGSTAVGGVKPYSYSWTPSTGLSSTTIAQPFANPATTTKYYVSVTDSNGCSTRDSINVIVNSLPTINAGNPQTICLGSSTQIGNSAKLGSGPYQYYWQPTTGVSDPTIPTPLVSPTATTKYFVTVTDAKGCQAVDSVLVIVRNSARPVITPSGDTNLCTGDSVTLDAGGSFRLYSWNNGSTGRSVRVGSTGSYIVTATDSNGCPMPSTPMQITLQPKLLADIKGPNSACPNSTVDYFVPKQSNVSFIWSLSGGGNITSGAGTNDVKVNWNAAGTWRVLLSITTQFGCHRDTSITVAVNSKLDPRVTPQGSFTLCSGDTLILRGSAGFLSYLWSDGSTLDSLVVTKSGSYTLGVTAPGGCTGTSKPVLVTILPDAKPIPIIVASARSICFGDSATLSTSQSFATYLWSNGEKTPSIIVRQSGIYGVIVTNAAGCGGRSDTVQIVVRPSPIATVTPSGKVSICGGDSVLLTASNGGVRYVWSNGLTSQAIYVSQAGDYFVRVTNSEGCESVSEVVHVVQSPAPIVSVTGPAAVCPNSSAIYSVASVLGEVYSWSVTGGMISSRQSNSAITIDWGAPGSGGVRVLVTDSITGCSSSTTLAIVIDSNLSPMITPSSLQTICEGDSVTFDAGAGFASYQWMINNANSVGATTQHFIARAAGDYSVFVTNSASCEGTSKAVTVVVQPLPPMPVITQSGNILTSSNAFAYQWNLNKIPITSGTAQSWTMSGAGNYTVAILDKNGCSNTSVPIAFQDSSSAEVGIPSMLSANPAEQVKIPMELLRSQNLAQSGAAHYTATLRFNKTLLAPSGATPPGVIVGNDLIVTISGTNPLSLGSTSGTLATLDFLATLGNDTCTDVSIDAFIWTDGNVSVTRQGGRFCLTGVCKTGGTIRLIDPNAKLSLSQTHPNPASNQTQVDYDLSEQGETKLFITDIMGREVKQIVTGVQLSGHYTATFDLTGFAQGTYIYTLQTSTQKLSHLMQIRR